MLLEDALLRTDLVRPNRSNGSRPARGCLLPALLPSIFALGVAKGTLPGQNYIMPTHGDLPYDFLRGIAYLLPKH